MKKLHSTFYVCFALILMLIPSYSAFGQHIQAIQINPATSAQTGQFIPSKIQPSALPEDIQKKLENNSMPDNIDQTSIKPLMDQVDVESNYEQYISGKIPDSVSSNIKQFGYDLFEQSSLTFSPSLKVPVGPGYVIGPDDEIRVTVWGKIEGAWDVIVDRDGNISLPKIGVLGVTGLTFTELKSLLHKELSKYYTGFEMNISMGALRSMRIYIVGNALKPGAYTVSSLSTLVSAMFETGGPSKKGSMRDIQLKRNGKTVVSFDMYDFLLKGDKTKDVRLMPEDVIFIPPIGPLVAIAGYINQPAAYELKEETRLQDLIELASGLTSFAFKGRIQVQRIQDHQFRTMFEDDLIDFENNPEKNFILADGDLIKIFSIIDTSNTIILTGAVANEGEYAIMPGITRLSDVIAKAGGIHYYASNEAELTRVRVTQEGPSTEILNIDLTKALEGDSTHNIPLETNDYLFIRAVPGWKLYETVSITGEVKYPGTYPIKTGESLSSLIERAGGYTDKAYLRGSFFTRESVRASQQKSLDEIIQRLESALFSEGSVQVSTASSREELSAKRAVVEQKQQFIESLKKLQPTGRMSIHLAHIRLLKNSKYDITLEQGDALHIPMKNSVVNVAGAVMSRGSFIYSDDLDYNDYIGMTGGYSRYADKDRIYVLKVDGTARKLSNGFFSWNPSKSRWEMDRFGEEIKAIEPGDSIVVPEKLEHIAWMREIKDITQILYQIATTAGVLIVAF